jgi:hypothetical protein
MNFHLRAGKAYFRKAGVKDDVVNVGKAPVGLGRNRIEAAARIALPSEDTSSAHCGAHSSLHLRWMVGGRTHAMLAFVAVPHKALRF